MGLKSCFSSYFITLPKFRKKGKINLKNRAKFDNLFQKPEILHKKPHDILEKLTNWIFLVKENSKI